MIYTKLSVFLGDGLEYFQGFFLQGHIKFRGFSGFIIISGVTGNPVFTIWQPCIYYLANLTMFPKKIKTKLDLNVLLHKTSVHLQPFLLIKDVSTINEKHQITHIIPMVLSQGKVRTVPTMT